MPCGPDIPSETSSSLLGVFAILGNTSRVSIDGALWTVLILASNIPYELEWFMIIVISS
jgi:hypothetical protein